VTTRTAAAPRATPDIAVAGAPAARRLVRDAVADPDRLRRVDIVGPGGHGKTVLLEALAAALRDAGVAVLRELPAEAMPLPPDAALLVDDAHLLDPARLERLTALAGAAGGRVVVAHRPWPRPPGTAALGAALAVHRPPLVLEALDPTGVGARAALLLRERPADDLVAFVHAQTAGVPVLVDRLIGAIVERAGRDRSRLALPDEPPAGLLAQLGYTLQTLDPGVRDLLLARALGAPLDVEVLVPLLESARQMRSPGRGAQAAPRDVVGPSEYARYEDLSDPPPPSPQAPPASVPDPPPCDASTRIPAPDTNPSFAGRSNLAGPAAVVDELVEVARAAGLLGPDGRPVPLVSAAVLARTPPASRLQLRRALAEIELGRGGSVLAVARGLLGTGASGARTAAVFVAAGDEALRTGDRSAGELYEAAARAGAPPLELAARRAEAAVYAGDLDLALAQADQVLAAAEQVPRADAVRAGAAAAAVLARRGLLARSAALHRWMGGPSGATVAAVPALIGTGALAEARDVLHAPAAAAPGLRPPTLLDSAEELIAGGVYEAVCGSPTAALSQLTRAAGLLERSHRASQLPDTPAALAALVAVHCGELDVAQSVLERAVRVGLGGRGALVRHRLLLGWIALFRGATPTARAALTAAAPAQARLEPRDELVAAALEVALARRAGDLGALLPAWARAREAIVRHPVDLFVLQQLGELSVAATRLRESSWMRPHLDEAAALLTRLGDPPLWTAPLHWSALHSAVLVENAEEAQRHADALAAGAGASRYAAALAAAAPQWVRLLRGEVETNAVEAAARGLHAAGLSWEGGKLAGQAAIRTRDRKAMTALLACARALQSAPVPRPVAEPAPDATTPPSGLPAARPQPGPAADRDEDGAESGLLSEREREVAVLVLEGLTYKQIGERLFISAKTVEHHVARMRQRLGSGSRGELFAHLRQIVRA
jgi:DNA-binding CsgD family transcriptional regulator